MDMTRMLVSAIVLILIIVALRYLYTWLNGSSDAQDVVVFSPAGQGLVANSGVLTLSSNSPASASVGAGMPPPPLYVGGEFSVSTWIYINNWTSNTTANKMFLTVSGNGGGSLYTLVMYLGMQSNKLGIRVSSGSVGDTGSVRLTGGEGGNVALINKLSGSRLSYMDDDFEMCDIDSIDLQRWVNIVAVVSGKTIDVYIDGKLTRSCILPYIYQVEQGINTTVQLGGSSSPGTASASNACGALGFGGYIGSTRMANYGYSPDYIYTTYLNGPLSKSMIGQLLGMFGINTMPKIKVTAPTISIV